ncbi:MAG TPA: dTMP kinase [Polyangiales bacterium]|nr:dTMP kinase [Polyangiales bacterium]
MFVVFEGIDGSGKTTLSSRVAKRLREGGLTVEHLREGGKFSSSVTQAIREFGRDARNLELTPLAEFMLFVTRDVQLLEERTRPALGQAQIVIADRFLYSAENLARYGRGLSEELVRPVLLAAANGLQPDLVILVDVDPHLARARRQAEKRATLVKRPPSRKGLAGVGLQHRMSAGYAALAAAEPERWLVVDNDGELEANVERVVELLRSAQQRGAPTAIARFRAVQPPRRPVPSALPSVAAAFAAFLSWLDARAVREPAVAAYFLSGLHGGEVDARRIALSERVPEALLSASQGLDDAVSWSLREQLAERYPDAAARSLSGLPVANARASALRVQLRGFAPLAVLSSYDTLADDEAYRLREALYVEHPALVIGSLNRLDDPRAWALRERFVRERGEGLFADYEQARLICKSVAWLDGERAWELRKAARETAPVAAIGSISGTMNSDRAWKWRLRWADRAPKTVFGTLRHNQDERSWPLRTRLAPMIKEAIDSIQDLDHAIAWQLREQHADLWPSTVLKSLGPLCHGEQGETLVKRQLARHPGNVSLLKHASAIALGLHSAAGAGD